MIAPQYRPQVELLLRILPHVAKEESLALKGGTAINLFERDMPRLSVDIDLTYLPFDERTSALAAISEALARIKLRLESSIPDIRAVASPQADSQETKLVCQSSQAQVKIEVNTVMRGHLWPARHVQLVQAAQVEFGMFATALVVSHSELYGGKMRAALDRQHPRDLFDISQLLATEGLTDDVRLGFIAALLSHTRPIHELIRPHFTDQRSLFNTQFAGMANIPFTYEDYEAAREQLVTSLHASLTEDNRKLLLSVKRGDPDWSLCSNDELPNLPAVRWKLANIEKLKKNARKHAQQLKALEAALSS